MGVYFASASTCVYVSHQYVFENWLFQLSGGTSCLFVTSVWQVMKECMFSTTLVFPGDMSHCCYHDLKGFCKAGYNSVLLNIIENME